MRARLRPAEPGDLDSLYAISLATGLRGGDASALYRDPQMMGHVYAAPYAALSPETAFVAEDEAGVGGYVVGCVDTRAFEERLEQEWWPLLRAQHPDPSAVPSENRNGDQKRSFMIHHPRPAPDAVLEAYPAHLHMNLLPRMQGHGVGTALLDMWRRAARALGAGGVHAAVNAENHRALAFWQARGFAYIQVPAEGTIWLGLR